jgi:hypothetical protein
MSSSNKPSPPDKLETLIFIVSEAEVCCDKDGVDSIVRPHRVPGLEQLAHAYRTIGADVLASACGAVLSAMPSPSDALLDRLNNMVCERLGYDYDSLRRGRCR